LSGLVRSADDLKTEVLLEWFEVPVTVQEGITLPKTKGGDPAVDRLPDGDSFRAQSAVVLRGGQREVRSSSWKDLERKEIIPNPFCLVISHALEDFAERDVRQPSRCVPRWLSSHSV
jgi:hypothetical protein